MEGHADLNRLAASATTHCLTGCVIGEVSGMVIATALGLGEITQMVIAIALAFFFGYLLTSLPLIRAGLTAGAVVSTAFASDTLSILLMESVDNGFILLVPGAFHAGLGDALFWWPLIVGFAVAWPFAFLLNRRLISRGKGHAVVAKYHAH